MKIFFVLFWALWRRLVYLCVYRLMSQVSVIVNHLIYRNQFEAWSLSGQLRVIITLILIPKLIICNNNALFKKYNSSTYNLHHHWNQSWLRNIFLLKHGCMQALSSYSVFTLYLIYIPVLSSIISPIRPNIFIKYGTIGSLMDFSAIKKSTKNQIFIEHK